ncbi:FxsA family protein [Geodermatophilus normandii]|uniref:FxsA family protein n=1 Tax=Geodermatophilus normandii TaxID=1137989 RepID=A0A6P0GI77_9ACTN|nr:FxsA family protein [Geodermatophilus normandii]
MAHRVRVVAGLWALAEVVVFVLVAAWIGVGWTLLAALATTVLGWTLMARQGTRALADLRERALAHRPPGSAGADAGLVAVGGVLMVLPGFLGDVVGLLCLLPPTRPLVRAAVGRGLAAKLGVARPVRVRSTRVETFPRPDGLVRVIEGEVTGEGHLIR